MDFFKAVVNFYVIDSHFYENAIFFKFLHLGMYRFIITFRYYLLLFFKF